MNLSGLILKSHILLVSLYCAGTVRVHGQEKLVKDTLLLGSYTEQGSAALIAGTRTVTLPKNSAYRLYEVPAAYFVEAMMNGLLTFLAAGDKGEIWEAGFRKNQLHFKSFTSDREKTLHITYHSDQLPSQTIMFSAADNKCYGMIKAVDFNGDDKRELPACVYSINDQEMLFEIFLNIDGKVLKGCGTFAKN
ncbi:hypothetical protein [Parapedobacter tibetensis]|uniref:hypothetical protein n=1 Tax=Parapedobacter tibetensis TaxID=2972951 RepID=UPI00214D5711|nr:hypothetical protein [Parapedobacter tibetensis]